MKITTVKTEKIIPLKLTLEQFLDKYIKVVKNKSVIVITSKVISIMENRLVASSQDKQKLIRHEADFLYKKKNKYDRYITTKFHAFISAAGIDESNGDGSFILLPKDPQKTAKFVHHYLTQKYKKKLGVIISDSRSMPLRTGAMGVAISFYGFLPIKDYVGDKDLFGREIKFEKANLVDGLASAAVLTMGECDEQTPIAVIEDVNFIDFYPNRPNARDLKNFYIPLEDDMFHPFYK